MQALLLISSFSQHGPKQTKLKLLFSSSRTKTCRVRILEFCRQISLGPDKHIRRTRRHADTSLGRNVHAYTWTYVYTHLHVVRGYAYLHICIQVCTYLYTCMCLCMSVYFSVTPPDRYIYICMYACTRQPRVYPSVYIDVYALV